MLVNYLENAAEKVKIYSFDTPAKLIKNIDMPGFGAVPISFEVIKTSNGSSNSKLSLTQAVFSGWT